VRCYHISSTSHLSLLVVVITSTQNSAVKKGHVEVYRASVDELLQFHQLKRNFNHLEKFFLKRKFFLDFICMNAMHTYASSLFLESHLGMLQSLLGLFGIVTIY
jgi:hypothetical protein